MTDWIRLIGGGFAHMDAQFALHPADKKRALEYRKAANTAGLTWSVVEGHVAAYGAKRGWSEDKLVAETKRVRTYVTAHLPDDPYWE